MKYPKTSTGKFPFFETEMLMKSYNESIKGHLALENMDSGNQIIQGDLDSALKLFQNTYGDFDEGKGKYSGLLGKHMKINAETIKINDIVDDLKRIVPAKTSWPYSWNDPDKNKEVIPKILAYVYAINTMIKYKEIFEGVQKSHKGAEK